MSDYCSICGNPKLFPEKPCPTCSSNILEKQINDKKGISLRFIFCKFVFYSAILGMLLWTLFCITNVSEICNISIEKSAIPFVADFQQSVLDFIQSFSFLIWVDFWFKPIVVLGLIALIFKTR